MKRTMKTKHSLLWTQKRKPASLTLFLKLKDLNLQPVFFLLLPFLPSFLLARLPLSLLLSFPLPLPLCLFCSCLMTDLDSNAQTCRGLSPRLAVHSPAPVVSCCMKRASLSVREPTAVCQASQQLWRSYSVTARPRGLTSSPVVFQDRSPVVLGATARQGGMLAV